MSSVLNKKGHITVNALLSLKSGTLTEDELIQVIEHISCCEGCSSILADGYDDTELMEVPSGFNEEILQKVYPKPITKRQFAFYSIRVGIAACAALAIVTFSSFNLMNDISSKGGSIKPPNLNFVNSINTGLRDFSHKILKMEVQKNEKEKK